MSNTPSKFYSVMVVGDNPEELMEKYKIGSKVEKYIKFKYLDAEKLQKNSLKMLGQVIEKYNALNLSKYQVDGLVERMNAIKNMTPFEYYQTITYGCTYDDEGNAWSDENPNGKWVNYQKGNHFSVPFINNMGEEVTSEINSKINWKLLHLHDAELYERVWELAKEGREPVNEDEQIIRDNMMNKQVYLSKFKNKEAYVAHNSAYWNYAYLDKNGWIDIDDEGIKDIDWIQNFYNRFVKPLKPQDRVTIFEFTRNSDD